MTHPFPGKPAHQAREPRSRLIGRFIEHWLDGTVEKQQAYADDVREIYHTHFPDPADRRIRFHATGDALHDLRENRQVVMRRLRGDIKLEADFEECAVLALPEAARAELLHLLVGRYGLLAVPVPAQGIEGLTADIARLTREFGEAVTAYGYLLADGEINEKDSPRRLADALKETDDLLAAATVFRQQVMGALERQQARLPIEFPLRPGRLA